WDVAVAVRELAPEARAVVGMSLGGLTALALSRLAPELVRSLVLVDVTPGVDRRKAASVIAFVDGPESFDSFEEMLARTKAFNPTRSESSLRRGILHNAVQREDGTWVWRHARHRPARRPDDLRFGELWDAVSALAVPLMLVRGTLPQSVVDDEDEAELRRRRPDARVERVEGAGHSVQGDRPVELARLIEDFLATVGGAVRPGPAAPVLPCPWQPTGEDPSMASPQAEGAGARPGDEPVAVVRAFLGALEDLDLDRALALVSPEIVYQNVPLPPARGRGPFEEQMRWLTRLCTGFEAR